MNFEFATATRIIFGEGKLAEIKTLAPKMGKRALIVAGARRPDQLLALLAEARIKTVVFAVTGEPNLDTMQRGLAQLRDFGAEMVISIGGGSALDSGKALAALATNPGDPLDYLEVVGKGQPLKNAPLPFIAIPTTAGTGAEVTSNSVLAVPEHRVKVSLRNPMMLPRVALVDPELTYSLPKNVTASTGMDAITQVLEPYVTHLATPLTDAICREGLKRGGASILRAYEGEQAARTDMMITSLFGGLALSNAKLGGVHGFAGVLGGMFDAPHGAICACLLPLVMEINIRALQARDPGNRAVGRYDEVAKLLTGRDSATTVDGVQWVKEVTAALDIPPLSRYGVGRDDLPVIVEKSAKSSSMKGNPIPLTDEEMTEILERAL